MPKFILHRIQRMTENPGAEKITPGLEAAAYSHWITCHERDPERFASVGPRLPELRQHVADYLELTAREAEAQLELLAAAQRGEAAAGTKDFELPSDAPPGRVEDKMGVQIGWNWVFLYWDPPARGGRPSLYRVYRTDKVSPPVLVATVTEPEALMLNQPEQVKWYYYVVPVNAAGEGPRSPDFGLMLNAPDQPAESTFPPQAQPEFPAHEMPIRRALGAAMMTFMQELMKTRLGNDEEDSVMRQVATEKYRQAVQEASAKGIEISMAWHTLATWTEDGKERIGFFARALECARAEQAARKNTSPRTQWCDVHMQADCLFEIGRVHFHEGPPAVARRFLLEALPLAQQADKLRAAAEIDHDDRLEGRIAELLLQLPEEEA